MSAPARALGDRSTAGGVRAVETRAYTVPTSTPREADGTLSWDSTTMVLALISAEGETGLGYTYGPPVCAAVIEELLAPEVLGADPLRPQALWGSMVDQVRNAGRPGIASLAISAVDTALWDLKARLLEVPLSDLLGAVRAEVPVYGSGGFTNYTDQQLADQLRGWLGQGMSRAKIKIGEDRGRRLSRDRRRLRQARRILGDDVELFADANGAYAPAEAVRLLGSVADVGVTWLEEPVSSDDLAGLRWVRERVEADVAAGEYGYDPWYYARMLGAGAVDCAQMDVTRCGGVTGWFEAAAVAAAHHVPVSAHCAPALSLAPCLATPGLRHVEWFHDHVRIESMLLDGAPRASGGSATPAAGPGNGLRLREIDGERYRVA